MKQVVLFLLALTLGFSGARPFSTESTATEPVEHVPVGLEEVWHTEVPRCLSKLCWRAVPDLPHKLAVFKGQVLAPDDPKFTVQLFKQRDLAKRARVLDLGTGMGLYALLAAQFGAEKVVATDIMPMAVANTVYNTELFGWRDVIEARLVPLSTPGAYSVVKPNEKFDLILCNPPGDDRPVHSLQDFQDFDPGYQFVKSIIEGLPEHLAPGGRLLLTYGTPPGLKVVQSLLRDLGLKANITSSEGTEDFLAHKVRASEEDYENGDISPVLEIYLPVGSD